MSTQQQQTPSEKIKATPKKDISIFGVSLNGFSQTVQFLIVCVLLFFFHITYGYLQERTLQRNQFPFAWYLVLLQFVYWSLFAYIESGDWKNFPKLLPRRGNLIYYALLSVVFVVGRIMGNISLHYIDFTTKVLLQCAKPVPVMILGIILLKKHYNLLQYIATSLLLFGLILFSGADAATSTTFSLFGLFCGVVNSFSLAFKSNMQELIMGPGVAKMEVAFYGNFIGIFVTLPVVLWTDELFPALAYCDIWLQLEIAVQYFFGYMGSICMLTLIQISDSFASSIASSTRQVLSIVLSFIIFDKQCTSRHVLACVLFFGGLTMYIWASQNKLPQKRKAED